LSLYALRWVELDAEALWSSVLVCLQELAEWVKSKDIRVVAAGITNQRETLVAFDKHTGIPLCHAISWMDTRTSDIVNRLASHHHARSLELATGLKFSPYFSAFKMMWLLENDEKVKQLSASASDTASGLAFCTVDSWIAWKLTRGAVFATDTSNASRTFLLKLSEGTWSDELLSLFGIKKDWLPDIRSTFHPDAYGNISKEYPFSELPITALIGDQQASLFGHWSEKAPSSTKVTFGTGAFILQGIPYASPQNAPAGILQTVLVKFPDKHTQFAFEAPIACAGSLITWLREGLGFIASFDELEASQLTLNSEPVYFVPHLTGSLFPYWNASARGSFHNLSLQSTKDSLILAVLESIAFSVRSALEQAGALFCGELSVDGGLSRNRSFIQLLASCCTRPVSVFEDPNATSIGAAIVASNFAIHPNPLRKRFEPDPIKASELNVKYAQWLRLCRDTE
jgi:glycerol kinase